MGVAALLVQFHVAGGAAFDGMGAAVAEHAAAQVSNEVRTTGGRLEIRPGRARGFGEGNWPFTRDASDSAEPILLPWQDRPVRYRLQGGRLRR